jgi:hypothetical protein
MENELNTVVSELERNVLAGIRIRSIFYEYNSNDAISIKYNETFHAHILNQLMSALCDSLILNLYRCWEDGNNRDFRSFPRSAVLLSTPENLDKIRSGRDGQVRLALIDSFLRRIDCFYRSNRHLSINISRNEGIAHSLEIARDRARLPVYNQAKMRHFYQTSVFNELMYKRLQLIWKNTTYVSAEFEESSRTSAKEFFDTLPSFRYSEIDREYFELRRMIERLH